MTKNNLTNEALLARQQQKKGKRKNGFGDVVDA